MRIELEQAMEPILEHWIGPSALLLLRLPGGAFALRGAHTHTGC